MTLGSSVEVNVAEKNNQKQLFPSFQVCMTVNRLAKYMCTSISKQKT